MKIVTLASAIVVAAGLSTAAHANNIIEKAESKGTFQTLLTAAEAAGLVETLKGDGPFTIFAPTDEAFSALPEGKVEKLLKPENKEELASILKYHVLPTQVLSTDLTDGMKAKTVNGTKVTIDLDNGPMVNEAKIVSADIKADNGVIHAIDKVILPN
ncbi:MAG: fasciclin domain-containing protein [Pseudomonadota bacterium]